uniref:Uncharacterized protein n=1 Tax=Ditylum brightwellii TaxID=49249 RepID=A0A7S2EMI6_9STRA|mmetsp:Transcript_35044/g.52288  ORF Transcript_35044/g.52288 Transcript_35044/m.52288 type:complete len:110 (+) Transcript_35044:76-405(+)
MRKGGICIFDIVKQNTCRILHSCSRRTQLFFSREIQNVLLVNTKMYLAWREKLSDQKMHKNHFFVFRQKSTHNVETAKKGTHQSMSKNSKQKKHKTNPTHTHTRNKKNI